MYQRRKGKFGFTRATNKQQQTHVLIILRTDFFISFAYLRMQREREREGMKGGREKERKYVRTLAADERKSRAVGRKQPGASSFTREKERDRWLKEKEEKLSEKAGARKVNIGRAYVPGLIAIPARGG